MKADVTVHIGDQGSKEDLLRVANSSSQSGFDIIIDDGSHLNSHQIFSLETLIPYLRQGGFYVIEDIHSACMNWGANMGSYTGPGVGGTKDCMGTEDKPTIYRKIVEWQKQLLLAQSPFNGISHIDVNFEAVVFEKDFP